MGHSHLDGAHTHGSSNAGFGVLDQLAQLIAIVGVMIVGIDVVMWLLHILIIIATAIGFLVVGAGTGYAAVKWRKYKLRRQLPSPSLYAASFPAQFPAYPYPSTPPALPPGGGEVHLHLHGADATEVLRAISHPGGDAR